MALAMHPSLAVHPGAWLRTEIVEPNRLSIAALAEAFGVSRQAISAVLNGRAALSVEMAIRFEQAVDVRADTLCRMQMAYDLSLARKRDLRIDKGKLAA